MPRYFSDPSRFINQPQTNPLDSLIQGVQQGVALRQLPQQIQQDALNQQINAALKKAKLEGIPLQRQQQELAIRVLQNQLDPAYQAAQDARKLDYENQRLTAASKIAAQYEKPTQIDVTDPNTGKTFRGFVNSNGTFNPIDITGLVNPGGLEQPPLTQASQVVPESIPLPENASLDQQIGASLQNLGGANLPLPNEMVKNTTPENPRIFAGVPVKPTTPIQNLFSEGSVDDLAQLYLQTGTLPPMGIGNAGALARSKVINRANELRQGTGVTMGDQLAKQSDVKAAQSELKKLQTGSALVIPAARLAHRNLQLASDLSKKVDRTGVPLFNQWINAGRRKITGNPDLSAYDTALRTAVSETAKVLNGTGTLSDTARKEVEDTINSFMTPEQVDAVIGTYNQEIDARLQTYPERIGELNSIISGRTSSEDQFKTPNSSSNPIKIESITPVP